VSQLSGGQIVIGAVTNVAPSQDPTIDLGRNVGGVVSHGFADDNILSGTNPYSSYDTRLEVTGSGNIDHFAGYQAIPQVDTTYTGILDKLINFVGYASINGGHVNTMMDYEVNDFTKTGTGSVGTYYGLYINPLVNASVSHGIYVQSNDTFLGGGAEVAGAPLKVDNAAAVGPAITGPWGTVASYNAFSLNGSLSSVQGLVGGSSGDPNLYMFAPGGSLEMGVMGRVDLDTATSLVWHADTGLSRDSAGVLDVGNGALGNASGSMKMTNLTLSGTCTGCGGGSIAPFTISTPVSGNSYFVSPGTTSRTFMGEVVNKQGVFSQNCFFDGTNWVYDTSSSSGCTAIRLNSSGSIGTSGFQISLAAGGTAGASIATMDTAAVAMVGNVGNQIWIAPGSSQPTFGTLAKLTVNPNAVVDNTAQIQLNGVNATDKVLVVHGVSGQTGDLQDWAVNSTTPLASVGANGLMSSTGLKSIGTKFTTAGCSVSSTTGGATAGILTLGANTCTVVITMNGATGLTATTGWTCDAHDRTAPTALIGGESSSTTTTASITIPGSPVGATDVISFSCTAF
jgi:hypothetical protein